MAASNTLDGKRRQGARRPWFAVDRDIAVPYGYCHCGCGERAPLATQTRIQRGQIAGEPVQYCRGHNNRGRSPLGFDAYDLVDLGHDTPCWIFRAVPTTFGYARMLTPDGRHLPAHRAFYERYRGPYAAGLTLDHLCHTNTSECAGGTACLHRRCVNPAHLEPVSRGENARRGRTVKLDAAKVVEIRALLDAGRSPTAIARVYGVSTTAIHHIKRGTTWANV